MYNDLKLLRGESLKKNIVLVSLNDFLRRETAKVLAKKKKMNYVDVDELLDFELISRKQVRLKCGDEFLKKLERKCIQKVSEYENCIASVSTDIFLANDNRDYFENFSIFYLATEIRSIDLSQVKNKEEKDALSENEEIFSHINDYLIATCEHVIHEADCLEIDDIASKIILTLKNKK